MSLGGEDRRAWRRWSSCQELVIVHCSGGSGRTGHVLAAWLVGGRGYGIPEALGAVWEMGRNPWEAVEHKHAIQEDLRLLLEACR